MRRTSRLRLALGACAAALVVGPLPGVSGQVACDIAAPRPRSDGWTHVRVPDFGIGAGELVDYTVLPFLPTTIFAINDRVVQRSLDGGCQWEVVYRSGTVLGGELPVVGELTLTGIEVAPSVAAASVVYVTATDGTRTLTLTSTNLGATWSDVSVGLPVASSGAIVRVTPNPRVAYALVYPNLGDGVPNHIYITRDAGQTWRPVNTDVTAERLDDFAVDAADPRALYAWNESGLYASTDSGATFRKIDAVKAPIATVDAHRFPPHKPARVTAFSASAPTAMQSRDGGGTWSRIDVPGVAVSAAHTYVTDAFAMASDRGVFARVTASGALVDLSPRGIWLRNLQWGNQSPLTLFGQDDHSIFLRKLTPQLRPVPRPGRRPSLPPVNLVGAAPVHIGKSRLTPASTNVSLLPGQKQKVRYILDLAPTPTPLDIFFTTDSTGSMSGTIGSLRENFQDIVNDLGQSGIDVWFGVGHFKDYPGFGGPPAHERLRKVGPIDEDLRDALNSLSTGGGSGLDSALASVYQTATGEGQETVEGSGSYLIPPGQGAEFRPDALKVIVLASDVESRHPGNEPGYPGPEIKDVIRALNKHDVKIVGLAVGGGEGPRTTMRPLAVNTDSVAGEDGVDCDGDGETDIDEGDALICSLGGGAGVDVRSAMTGLLKSVTDLQTVQLEVAGEPKVAYHASAQFFDEVNVKEPNRLGFDVEFTCTPETVGETYPVKLRASAGQRHVAEAVARVTCLVPAVAVPPAREIPPPEPPRIVAGLAVPPPPPPAPVPQAQPNLNPNPNPNPQMNPQVNPNPNTGMAFEEQEQIQVALAHSELGLREMEELAMVGNDRRDEQAAGVLLYGGMAMAGLAGAAVAARSRTAAATARARAGRR